MATVHHITEAQLAYGTQVMFGLIGLPLDRRAAARGTAVSQ
jgi:hypothetical protein